MTSRARAALLTSGKRTVAKPIARPALSLGTLHQTLWLGSGTPPATPKASRSSVGCTIHDKFATQSKRPAIGGVIACASVRLRLRFWSAGPAGLLGA